jgi:hypothetical protein
MDQDSECYIPSLDLPDDWSCLKTVGPGPFVTKAIMNHPKGSRVQWNSRDQRKHHNLLEGNPTSTWYSPNSIGWWVGILFAIGASCFAFGAVPMYLKYVGIQNDGLTFFVGSIFFTTASLSQYIETINARQTPIGSLIKEKIRFITWEPRRIDWLASVVQLIGTVLFNISTFYALNFAMTSQEINHLVWAPDALGSICFLIASGLVWLEVGHSLLSWQIGNLSWRIALLNLVGSVAFGVSAVSAFMPPMVGHPLNIVLVNFGTFVGAVCFFSGAILLLPERTSPDVIMKNSDTVLGK